MLIHLLPLKNLYYSRHPSLGVLTVVVFSCYYDSGNSYQLYIGQQRDVLEEHILPTDSFPGF